MEFMLNNWVYVYTLTHPKTGQIFTIKWMELGYEPSK
jgi:hypothetical protein